MQENIVIHGAREHNLKNIDVTIPRDKLVVVTGVSGSGKSSLAFETLYAEGQRRYVESLSAYARQFLGNMDKPDVDSIDGLSPAISIDQKTTSKNPRSTVGTVTEINDYLRLLYARVGTPYCINGHGKISAQSPEEIVNKILELPEKTRLQILAPVVRAKKGTHVKVFERIQKDGYVRVRVDGEILDVGGASDSELEKNKKHDIEVVVDRIVMKSGIRSRLFDSVESALRISEGYVIVDTMNSKDMLFSEFYACPLCGFTVPELEPRLFSFNAPFGQCSECEGLGMKLEADVDLLIPDPTKTLHEGAIVYWYGKQSTYYPALLEQACTQFGIPLDVPWEKLPEKAQDVVLHGTKKRTFHFRHQGDFGYQDKDMLFVGVIPNLWHRYRSGMTESARDLARSYMTELPCTTCHGRRLNDQALCVKVGNKNIAEFSESAIVDTLNYVNALKLSEQEETIARPIIKEIGDRLTFLKNVGLDYLTLSRAAGTLSGGESQRIRLATQIGSNLSGVLYILDEPSIGLHQRDNDRLIESLKKMRDLGNTLIVVEHDEDTMWAADWLIDVGPGAGDLGGEIIASGTPSQVAKNKKSLTGRYLSGAKSIPIPKKRRKINEKNKVTINGAEENNLKKINVSFPLGVMTAVTGVSGSGKSTLVNSILKKALVQKINRNNSDKPGKYKTISGFESIDRLIDIDQSPIGRTPRSNPATYTSVFDDIRDLFAATNEAKIRGYKKGRFSFNVKGGRCEACSGDGIIKIEMNFLPDVYVPCEVCHGKRYNSETLEVHYKGKNISEVLELRVSDALEFFRHIPKIERKLQTIVDVGLGYVQMGQPATTLSGGEAQRMKLASELQKRATGKTLYILDEPTTGLHTDDIATLLEVMNRLVDAGNTIVVIEHNLDVIKTADWIIDLGPEGGAGGGTVIATGTPEEVARVKTSYTGQYLMKKLKE